MKKVLCIDGGGIRGLIPALVLSAIEEKTQRHIASMFDLIAGTSSGLGLSVPGRDGLPKHTAEEISHIYTNRGYEIFSSTFWNNIVTMYGLIDEKYKHEPLKKILTEYLGDTVLESSVTKLLICSYDIENQRTFFFKSWKEKYRSVKMKDVARATTAAPSYFEPAQIYITDIYK